MKIYFEDGKLQDRYDLPFLYDKAIDAGDGYSKGDNELLIALKYTSKSRPNYKIYTNLITALSNEYAWNEELQVPDIYIRNKRGEFTRVDKLTNRELRQGHNIMKMYMAGEFSE